MSRSELLIELRANVAALEVMAQLYGRLRARAAAISVMVAIFRAQELAAQIAKENES